MTFKPGDRVFHLRSGWTGGVVNSVYHSDVDGELYADVMWDEARNPLHAIPTPTRVLVKVGEVPHVQAQ
jgi:hypothetical protein